MQFALLADHPEAISQIASWYFEEWGHLRIDRGLEELQNKLRDSTKDNELPIFILAIEDDAVAGVVELKFREMDIYPEKEHWLGGVFVPAAHRGKGVAARLIKEALRIARTLDTSTLWLQTEDLQGGLYAKLGWIPLETVTYYGVQVLVMQKQLAE